MSAVSSSSQRVGGRELHLTASPMQNGQSLRLDAGIRFAPR